MISAMIPLPHEYIYYRNNSIVITILSRIEELQMVTQRIMPWDICYGYIDNPASCMIATASGADPSHMQGYTEQYDSKYNMTT